MAPVFSNMGLAFDSRDAVGRSRTPAADREHMSLSKAERLLGVSDTGGPLQNNGISEWRPRPSKLRTMGSNLSLFTDLRKVISGASPRSASRMGRNAPIPMPGRPGAMKLGADQRSIVSDTGDYSMPPHNAELSPSYHYKDSPASQYRPEGANGRATRPQEKPKMLQYSEEDQQKIMANLMKNGMMPTKDKQRSKSRPHTAKGHDERSAPKHSRGNSTASKSSHAASSRYSRDQDGRRYSHSKKDSTSSTAQPEEATPRRTSVNKSSQVLTPRIESQAPGIRISRIESPEGERIRTWLTYTDMNPEVPNGRGEWLAPAKSGVAKESRSTTSVHTMASQETGTLFPIQGGPDDWSTIRRHSRQSSVLVNSTAVSEQAKVGGSKGGKVFYTDLQHESVLALSGSDSESDAESESSALARKRLSLASNGNDTQPTAWSSTASSRSQSRKMSLNTHATSPQERYSFSSDQWNYPIPNPQVANLSREPSGSSLESPRRPRHSQQLRQPSPMHQEVDETGLPEVLAGMNDDAGSHRDHVVSSSPTLSPIAEAGPQLGRMTAIADEQTPNPLIEAIRAEGRARKDSTSSTHTTSSQTNTANPRPAPTRPLPMPPGQTQSPSTPTIQTPSADDDSSTFSFPKPPRVLNRAASRSTDMLASPTDSATPNATQYYTTDSIGSDGSCDTVRASSVKRKHSNLSIAATNDPTSPGVSAQSSRDDLLSPQAAYRDGNYVIEEFSPIVFAFPEHIRQQMEDNGGTHPEANFSNPLPVEQLPKTRSYSESDILSAATAAVSSTTPVEIEYTPPTDYEPAPVTDPIPATIYEHEEPSAPSEPRSPTSPSAASRSHPRTASPYITSPYIYTHAPSSSTPFPRGPHTAPLPLTTGLSPVAERPGSASSTGIRTAPASVQTHWEKALATRFPAVPLPQVGGAGPARPLRRFHLPTTSSASTMTSRSAPSPKSGQLAGRRESVGPASSLNSLSGSPPNAAGWGADLGWVSRSRGPSPAPGFGRGEGMRERMNEMASVRNSPSPGPGGRTMRTSKRISTGKGIEPLRLSRIGNAV